MPNRKTHEQYVAEVAKINPNIEVYIEPNKAKIAHRNTKTGDVSYVCPSSILTGHKCSK